MGTSINRIGLITLITGQLFVNMGGFSVPAVGQCFLLPAQNILISMIHTLDIAK